MSEVVRTLSPEEFRSIFHGAGDQIDPDRPWLRCGWAQIQRQACEGVGFPCLCGLPLGGWTCPGAPKCVQLPAIRERIREYTERRRAHPEEEAEMVAAGMVCVGLVGWPLDAAGKQLIRVYAAADPNDRAYLGAGASEQG